MNGRLAELTARRTDARRRAAAERARVAERLELLHQPFSLRLVDRSAVAFQYVRSHPILALALGAAMTALGPRVGWWQGAWTLWRAFRSARRRIS